jgi:hypothetical protein
MMAHHWGKVGKQEKDIESAPGEKKKPILIAQDWDKCNEILSKDKLKNGGW